MNDKTGQPEKDHHCRDLLERFSAYLERDLDASCCEELEKHLDECHDCVDTMDRLKELVQLCREASSEALPEPSADLRRRILDSLEGEPG